MMQRLSNEMRGGRRSLKSTGSRGTERHSGRCDRDCPVASRQTTSRSILTACHAGLITVVRKARWKIYSARGEIMKNRATISPTTALLEKGYWARSTMSRCGASIDCHSGRCLGREIRLPGPDLDHANLVPNDPAFPPSSQLPLVVPARDARTENYNGDRPNCAPHYTKRGAERRVMQRKNREGRNVSLHHRRYRLHRPPPGPSARGAGANRHLHGH